MTGKEQKPRGFWKGIRAQLEADAQTMSNAEMAKKYDTTLYSVSFQLSSLGIVRKKTGKWKDRLDELKELCERMDTRELAAHFGVAESRISATLSRFGLKCKRVKTPCKLDGREDEITQLAPAMTLAELARHLGVHWRTLHESLRRLEVSCKPASPDIAQLWGERAEQIRQMLTAGTPVAQIARGFDVTDSMLRRRMAALGINPGELTPERGSASAKRMTALPSRQPMVRASVPYTPKPPPPPPKIIVPADVKITIVPLDTTGARICNGSSTQVYNPAKHGGVMRSHR